MQLIVVSYTICAIPGVICGRIDNLGTVFQVKKTLSLSTCHIFIVVLHF